MNLDHIHFAGEDATLNNFSQASQRWNVISMKIGVKQVAVDWFSRKVARVFVALPEKSREVAGVYALSAGSIERATFPPEDVKRLPRYPVPVALIGRLAMDRSWAGQGLGSALLADASVHLLDTTRCLSVYHHRLRRLILLDVPLLNTTARPT